MTLNFSLFGSSKSNNKCCKERQQEAFRANMNMNDNANANAYGYDLDDDEELQRKMNLGYYSSSSSSSLGQKQSLHCSLMSRFLGRRRSRSKRFSNKFNKETSPTIKKEMDGPKKTGTPALILMEEQVGRRGPVVIPVSGRDKGRLPTKKQQNGTLLETKNQTDEMELKVYHRLLEERLLVLEGLTGTLQNWQKEERSEYERCMTELATQVSRAVGLQQLMKSEVERLQQRVVDLESHNKAMTTMIVPTLIKLHGAIGRDSTNPGAKKTTTTTTLTNRGPEKYTQSLERKVSQLQQIPTVKSPKQRKIDCRIPARINSGSRISRTNPPKQAGTELEKKKTSNIDQVDSSSKSSSSTPPPSSSLREDEVSLSSPTSSKSESSSSVPLSYGKCSKGVRTSGSSSYSGIPRMSSPRPLQQGRTKGNNPDSGSSCIPGPSSARNRKNEPNNINGGSSRLPVRRNLSTGTPSPTDKRSGKTDDGERATSSLTFLRKGPSKINSNSVSLVKSAVNCSIVSATATAVANAVAPKTGKDEGYSTMSSEALAEQENAVKCQSQSTSLGMHKSNTFNTFLQSDTSNIYRAGNDCYETRSPKRINFTSLPTGAGRKPMSSGPRSTVRIIRGITSYDAEMDCENGDDPSSTSTILWEDSDDSDILFLPLEMSSEASSSRSTLVPSSASFISTTPNGLRNSSSSRNSSSTLTTSTAESAYPLRRSRGEELVALLAAHRGHRGGGGEVDQDEMEERALIEKWMRLEDVRNEVQWDDEWAWDWDGVARTHKLSRVLSPPKEDDDDSEYWFASKSPMRKTLESNESSITPSPSVQVQVQQIDSSTWTKSKKSYAKKSLECEEKLRLSLDEDLDSNSAESRFEKVLDGDGDNEVENEKGLLINASTPGVSAAPADDGSPPVIEFTAEFYHLVNYGSNLSVSDNEHSPTHGRKTTATNVGGSSNGKIGGLRSAKWVSGKMDDKVSQTDFSSSLENLSVSSELFTECRNCLELIKKLVGNGGGEENSHISGGCQEDPGSATLDRHRIHERDELKTDLGSPTAWVSVPKGLPTNEVDQILEILSSSESEDILSLNK